MKEITLNVPKEVTQPILGFPYTWGTGSAWYVRLEDGAYRFTSRGLKRCESADDHRNDAEDFRYATTIRLSDYKDSI